MYSPLLSHPWLTDKCAVYCGTEAIIYFQAFEKLRDYVNMFYCAARALDVRKTTSGSQMKRGAFSLKFIKVDT